MEYYYYTIFAIVLEQMKQPRVSDYIERKS